MRAQQIIPILKKEKLVNLRFGTAAVATNRVVRCSTRLQRVVPPGGHRFAAGFRQYRGPQRQFVRPGGSGRVCPVPGARPGLQRCWNVPA